MTDNAFLADILENPDDDAPRLIYADWLEDNGDPERGEFIRLQCAAASAPHTVRPADQQRQAELLERHRAAWAGRLSEYTQEYTFRRGFIESARVSLSKVLPHAGVLFDRHPLRMIASHLATADEVRRLARTPYLSRLTVLNLSSSMRESTFRTLMESPHLGGLRGLSVHDSPLGLEGLQALLDTDVLPRLTHLDLSSTGIGSDGVNALAASPKSAALLSLNIRGNNLTIASLRQIDAGAMQNLRRLGIWFNRLRDNGLEAMLRLPLFARLRHLDIGYNHLTRRGALALAASPLLGNLRSLWMGVDRLDDDGMLALAHSPNLHPEARLAFWFCDYLSDHAKRQAELTLPGRIQFDRGLGLPEHDPPVGWPLWRP